MVAGATATLIDTRIEALTQECFDFELVKTAHLLPCDEHKRSANENRLSHEGIEGLASRKGVRVDKPLGDGRGVGIEPLRDAQIVQIAVEFVAVHTVIKEIALQNHASSTTQERFLAGVGSASWFFVEDDHLHEAFSTKSIARSLST